MDKARLKCRVVGTEGEALVIEGKAIDGETFSIRLTSNIISHNIETKECWIEVDYFGKSSEKASIGLPASDMRMGKNITVSVDDIDRTEEIIKMLEEKAKKAKNASL